MAELKTLTMGGKKYDSFPDLAAREDIEQLKQQGGGESGGSTDAQVKIEGTDIEETCIRFSSKLYDTDKAESFLFFSDPHLATATNFENRLNKYISTVKTYYDATPTSFVLNGGDTIHEETTAENACYRLGMVDARMRANFDRYYPAVGNHDMNETGDSFTNATIRNLMLNCEDKLYYSFDGSHSKCYVLNSNDMSDTALAEMQMTDYYWEQLDWLADKLKTDDADNTFLLYHVGYTQYGNVGDKGYQPSAFTVNTLKLCEAYNNSGTVTLNGKDYNFAECKGCVRFILTGHMHKDIVETHNGIPVIAINYMRKLETTPTFDLCLADYDNEVLHMVRVGDGGDNSIVMGTRGFTGEVFNVSLNLTNVTANSAVVNVREGDSYTNTLTIPDLYTLSSVVVTMGGVDVTSTAYGGGQISIASVTGDIVVTATATYDDTSNLPGDAVYTNLADPTSTDWSNNAKHSSYGAFVSGDGVLTNFIPVKAYDRLRFYGFDTETNFNGQAPMISFYDENKNYIESSNRKLDTASKGTSDGVPTSAVVDENGVFTYTVLTYMDGRQLYGNKYLQARYVRINAMPTVPVNEIAITVNEHIFTPESRGANLADPASADWYVDARLAMTGPVDGVYTDQLACGCANGQCTVTNFIPLVKNEVLRVKGFDWDTNTCGISPAIFFYDENKTFVTEVITKTASYGKSDGLVAGSIDENGVLTYTAYWRADTNAQYTYKDTCERAKYIRISALRTVPEDEIVITVNEPIGVTLITFTMPNGAECQAEDGMTWGEWIASKYNTSGYVLQNGYVSDPIGQGIYDYADGGHAETADSIIIAGHHYIYD